MGDHHREDDTLMVGDPLHATIDRFEEAEDGTEVAVLVFDDGQQLILPTGRLPDGCRNGTVLSIAMTPDEAETNRRFQRVKQVQSRLFDRHSSE